MSSLNNSTFKYGISPSHLGQKISDAFRGKTKLKFLELGGYYGRDALELIKKADITIIENDPEAPILNRILINNNGDYNINSKNKIRYIIDDFLTFKCSEYDNSFDCIYSYNFLHLFNEKEIKIIIGKVYQMLKSDGVFINYFISDRDEISLNKEGHPVYKLNKSIWEMYLFDMDFRIKKFNYEKISESHHGIKHDHIMYFLYAIKESTN